MAEEVSDEARERIRADLRRAGLLPDSLLPPAPEPVPGAASRRRAIGFLVGFVAPALTIIGFALALVEFGPG